MFFEVLGYASGVYEGYEFGPSKAGDAGLDLKAAESVTVHAGKTEAIGLGIAVEIPAGHVGWLTGRSSTALGRSLLTHEGKIDSGYRGELHILVTALGSPVEVDKGDRIAQLIVMPIVEPVWQEVGQLNRTERGSSGLGSTGLR